MGFKKTSAKRIFLGTFLFIGILPLQGCITSERQDQLQKNIDKVQSQLNKIQNNVQQLSNSEQNLNASQIDLQSLKDQLQLTQGDLLELKNRIKHIEETAGAGSTTVAPDVVNLNHTNNSDISSLQKRLSRVELLLNDNLFSNTRKGKLPVKIKNQTVLEDSLKTWLDSGDFKKVILISTQVLNAQDASQSMLGIALEYRGEAKFQMKDYRGAALDLGLYAEKFPKQSRSARALLLTGDSYVYLKNSAAAKFYYQECAKNYGSTAEGKAAADRLGKLTKTSN